MKNKMLVDVDSDRTPHITIGKHESVERPKSAEEFARVVIFDMACLCEAVVTLIHLAERHGIKPSPDSLRDCIAHLEKGTFDASFQGLLVNQTYPTQKK